ncbi:hypothetical protein HY629_03130 [Candidatus Uhrbacteria bacterium]|nr:hypothetical protein [Candidatus Uhrbacteria bacterium]
MKLFHSIPLRDRLFHEIVVLVFFPFLLARDFLLYCEGNLNLEWPVFIWWAVYAAIFFLIVLRQRIAFFLGIIFFGSWALSSSYDNAYAVYLALGTLALLVYFFLALIVKEKKYDVLLSFLLLPATLYTLAWPDFALPWFTDGHTTQFFLYHGVLVGMFCAVIAYLAFLQHAYRTCTGDTKPPFRYWSTGLFFLLVISGYVILIDAAREDYYNQRNYNRHRVISYERR